MKIAICDDEPYYVEKTKDYISNYFKLKKIKFELCTFTNPTELLKSDLTAYNLAFLDVDMPDFNGIEIGTQLRRANNRIILIYVSALVQYAIDGYSVHAFQYLLKQDLESTMTQCMDDVLQRLPTMAATFLLPTDLGGLDIPLSDILYFEVQNHTITVHTQRKARSVWTYNGIIAQVEAELTGEGFLRIYKSYLVNMEHITKMSNNTVLLSSGEILPCSRQNFKSLLKTYLLWEGKA